MRPPTNAIRTATVADAEPQAQATRRGQADRFQMGEQIARREDREDSHDWQVAPIAARQNLAQHHGAKRDREGEIQHRGCQRADQPGDTNRDPAQDPNRSQQPQGAAAYRQAAGPVGNRGQQETGDHGGDETEQHLVRVPDSRIEGRGQYHETGQIAEPERDRQGRPDPTSQKEWPESDS